MLSFSLDGFGAQTLALVEFSHLHIDIRCERESSEESSVHQTHTESRMLIASTLNSILFIHISLIPRKKRRIYFGQCDETRVIRNMLRGYSYYYSNNKCYSSSVSIQFSCCLFLSVWRFALTLSLFSSRSTCILG